MVMALGRGAQDEYKDGLHEVSHQIVGQAGLFCTNSGPEEVLQYFDEYTYPDYARSGSKATDDFVLPGLMPFFSDDLDVSEFIEQREVLFVHSSAGPLNTMPFSMEPQLRQLGLQTRLREGML
jgi:mRNA turnover protein 4